jgi:hypothetical protein
VGAAETEETARRRADFRQWAATHGLTTSDTVGIVEGTLAGARIRVATGLSDKGHWPIIVDMTAPLDRGARLADLVRAPGMPRSLTSLVALRAGARLRFRPNARLEDIELVVASLPRSDVSHRPYR